MRSNWHRGIAFGWAFTVGIGAAQLGCRTPEPTDLAPPPTHSAEPRSAAPTEARQKRIWTHLQTLAPPPGVSGEFGHALAMDGGRIAVAVRPMEGTSQRPRVVIYQRTAQPPYAWRVEDILGEEHGVGMAVDLERDRLIAASHEAKAEVFQRDASGWKSIALLVPPDPPELTRIGGSVALTSQGAVVSMGGNVQPGVAPLSGQVVVYDEANDWKPGQIIRSSSEDLLFGDPLTVDDGVLLLKHNDNVLVLERSESARTWNEATTWTLDDHTLGYSLDVQGPRAMVSAWLHESAQRVLFFERDVGSNAWRLTDELQREGPTSRFGHGLSFDGDVAVLGAHSTHAWAGSAFFFERVHGEWVQTQQVAPPVLEENDIFGAAVAIEGDFAAIAAPRRGSYDEPAMGEVFIFQRTPEATP